MRVVGPFSSGDIADGGVATADIADSAVTYAKIANPVAQGTITTDLNAMGWTTTWNNSGQLFTALKLSVTNTASTTFSKLLDLQVDGSTKLSVTYSNSATTATLVGANIQVPAAGTMSFGGSRSNFTSTADGTMNCFASNGTTYSTYNAGPIVANKGTAIPAGGTAGAGLMVSSTANFGVFFGSGAPSLAAAKGSLYLRSDGSSTSTRAYINTDGSTTWTAITTAA